jgi:alpha/beta superfamily hydrolase
VVTVGAIDLAGPVGRLEALLEAPPSPRFAAVVCHPHPLYGGTMHTHAVHRLARALRAEGGLTLRFNFRGVGRSAGAFGHLAGEADDAAAALAALAARHPALPRVASGFSFGAFAALAAAARDPGVVGLLLAGVAVRPVPELPRDLGQLTAERRPVAVVQAGEDGFGTPDEVRAAVAGAAGPRRVAEVAGAAHLFGGALDALEAEARVGAAWVLAQAPVSAG